MNGQRVALTGAVDDLGRSGFREAVAAAGAVYAAALEDGVDVLVVGDKPLASKVARARELGVEVVEWPAFRERLGAAASAGQVPIAHPDESLPRAPAMAWGDRLRILDVELPFARPAAAEADRVPALATFDHYTLDAHTLVLLRFLARAVQLRQPCLVEGETATSKTSAVFYLAARLGQPVARLNLNGQTDASELVGRYVPDGAGWRFEEGMVPTAMRRGWWLVLDEVNLAEPAVLERLNPVLERHPSLVVTEGDGARIGGGGAEVHPDFRVFATMNPAEYQGRSVLSPAWRDRFVATWQAEAPGELQLRQMLTRLVWGRQPDVEVLGLGWQGAMETDAPYATLRRVPGIDGLLARLASLHAAMAAMSGAGPSGSLGAHRRERYVFTRRSLLGLLDALRDLELVDLEAGRAVGFAEAPARLVLDAVERTYLDRVRGEEDRTRVVNVLRTLGLTREEWVDPFRGDVW